MEAITRIPALHNRGSAARETFHNQQIAAHIEAFETGMDPPLLINWVWPYNGLWKRSGSKIDH